MAQLAKNLSLLTIRQQTSIQILAARACNYSTGQSEKASYKCVVLGGGTGGCAMAAKMTRKFGAGQVAVVEPNDVSLMGGGGVKVLYYFHYCKF